MCIKKQNKCVFLRFFLLLYVYVCAPACLCVLVNTVVHGGQKETLNLLEL